MTNAKPKKIGLSAGLATILGSSEPPADTIAPAGQAPTKAKRPGKAETVMFPLRISLDDRKRLKRAALDNGESMQKIIVEGINLWLSSHGQPPLDVTE